MLLTVSAHDPLLSLAVHVPTMSLAAAAGDLVQVISTTPFFVNVMVPAVTATPEIFSVPTDRPSQMKSEYAVFTVSVPVAGVQL